MNALPRPHDLVWLADEAALRLAGENPSWATPAWLAAAPLVLRRAPRDDAGRLPVGLRGRTRSERCAAHADASGLRRRVTPESVARHALTDAGLRDSPRPCLRSLARIAPLLEASGLAWGVTGGVGFSLASGLDVLRDDSDLDLLLRAPHTGQAHALREIGRHLALEPARIDVQVEAPAGAFALLEWLRTGGPVLLKTEAGPRLGEDPWATA